MTYTFGLNFYEKHSIFTTFYAFEEILSLCLKHQNMLLTEAQLKVDDWIKKVGVRYFSELTNTALLMEEVGELARIMARKYGEQSAKPTDNTENMADEMADVLFVLICLANQTGVDLTAAFEKNLEKKYLRDAERHKNNPKLNPSTSNDEATY